MIEAEFNRRLNLWQLLRTKYGTEGIAPSVIRELKIYYGYVGTWRDPKKTNALAEHGVTVGVLHTGKHYPDDWSEDSVLYHFPQTNRHPSFDQNEIEATKAAGILKLPLFVVTHNANNQNLRDVHLGWIVDWDDTAKAFLILFQDEPPVTREKYADEGKFELFDERPRKRSMRNIREDQPEFRFDVFRRYGTKCALCSVSVKELLEAIHLVPKSVYGTNDPRNGLVMCVLHHKAFDAGLFGIEPKSTRIKLTSSRDINKKSLSIEFKDLRHLSQQPHIEALTWNWDKFQEKLRRNS